MIKKIKKRVNISKHESTRKGEIIIDRIIGGVYGSNDSDDIWRFEAQVLKAGLAENGITSAKDLRNFMFNERHSKKQIPLWLNVLLSWTEFYSSGGWGLQEDSK